LMNVIVITFNTKHFHEEHKRKMPLEKKTYDSLMR